ncbi:sugar ABC transporter ATP-binding protein [Arachidicoccus terrestris]|uniref:sugar ABC transporter ATP-binding protein n=1 Tax=Arachidicoccus terrestris TaxID=2875539 RepID=UPI001CC6E449|nr:sugar ABC transporter ATP-binding protein [Arachidicoccus terrestris]UAY56949.1 sugar ABC transporter ATP-binding protein [Arachidicoccus terrestris]
MVELKGISKSYGGIQALDNVNLTIEYGKIHALLGENGAGKSTLMKVLSGAVKKDTGIIRIDGEERDIDSPKSAREEGIGIIYQEFSLVPELTAAENIYLNQLGDSFWIDWKALYKNAAHLIESLGFQLDVRKKVANLSVAEQQIVEIAKALTSDIKLIIFDEPSDVLGAHEVAILYKVLDKLKKKNIAIIYISHHLPEILEISDSITVLRDGKSVATVENKDLNNDKLIALMLGKSLQRVFRNPVEHLNRPSIFSVSGVRLPMGNADVELEARSGEILGIAGLVGSGRTELLRAIFGADGAKRKKVSIDDVNIQTDSPKMSVAGKIGMVPEDRKKDGGILSRSIRDNISMTNYALIKNAFGFIQEKIEQKNVTSLVDRLKIKCASIDSEVGSLSGGNQQKVILAKWINSGADILLIDEPTRGVDVGARAQIYDILFDLANKGKTLIVVSSDLEELMTICDRVAVMKKGVFTGEVLKEGFSEEKLLRLAIE